jgi:hypothetical protein
MQNTFQPYKISKGVPKQLVFNHYFFGSQLATSEEITEIIKHLKVFWNLRPLFLGLLLRSRIQSLSFSWFNLPERPI